MTRRIPFNFLLFCLLLASCQQTNEDLLDKAFKLSKDKKYDEAIKVYGEIIKSNNKIQLAYYNRGHCYLYLKNYPKALADFNKVMSLQIVDDVIITYNDKLPYSREEDRTQVPYFDALYNRAQVKFFMDSINSSFKDFQFLIDNEYKMKTNCILWQGTLWIKAAKNGKACECFQKAKQLGDPEADEMIKAYCNK